MAIITAVAVVAATVAPMLTASAAPTSAQESASEGAAIGNPSTGLIPDSLRGRAFATKAEADAATAAVKAAHGDDAPRALAAGQGVNSWIYITDSVGYFTHVRADPTIRFYIDAGCTPCRNLTLGGRYSGCGYTSANGWILLPNVWQGPITAVFVISACTVDP